MAMGRKGTSLDDLDLGEIWCVTHYSLMIETLEHDSPPGSDYVVSRVPEILVPYHRALSGHIALVDILRSHSISFDESRDAILKWAEQPWLEEHGWDAEWEDLCSVEIDRWNK